MMHEMQHSSSPTAITLRNLPPKLVRKIQERAREEGTSLNKAVIHMLEEGVGLTRRKEPKRVYDDLRELAGKWSEQEAAEFDRALRESRSIDDEMWK